MTGRPTDEADAVGANVYTQDMVDKWLHGWKEVIGHVWRLQKAYGDDKIWFRVTNNQQGAEIIMDATGNRYDVDLTWNTINADEEKQAMKLEKLGTVLAQFDRNGQVDFGEFARIFVESMDPNLATRLIMRETAIAKEEEGDFGRHRKDRIRSGCKRTAKCERSTSYASHSKLFTRNGRDTRKRQPTKVARR